MALVQRTAKMRDGEVTCLLDISETRWQATGQQLHSLSVSRRWLRPLAWDYSVCLGLEWYRESLTGKRYEDDFISPNEALTLCKSLNGMRDELP